MDGLMDRRKQANERPDFVPLLIDPMVMLEPRTSVKIITNAAAADAGKFCRYQGEKNPW